MTMKTAWPAASVSGLYFAHPQTRYFSVDRITRDQVENYAARKGVSVAEVERWLAEQLGVEAREMPPPETAPAHKRCRNSAMLATGFTLAYPDYRAGYGEVLSRRSD